MKLQQSKSKGKENMNDTREKKIKWKNAQMPEMNVKNVKGVTYLTYPAFEGVEGIVYAPWRCEPGNLHFYEPELHKRR